MHLFLIAKFTNEIFLTQFKKSDDTEKTRAFLYV
jgi:hypothetical protein